MDHSSWGGWYTIVVGPQDSPWWFRKWNHNLSSRGVCYSILVILQDSWWQLCTTSTNINANQTFGFLSGPLTWYDRPVSDSPKNDRGEVSGRLLNAGCVLAATIFCHEDECCKTLSRTPILLALCLPPSWQCKSLQVVSTITVLECRILTFDLILWCSTRISCLHLQSMSLYIYILIAFRRS